MSDSNTITRRDAMRRAGAIATGAGAAYYGGSQAVGSPVQNGEAVAPLVIAGYAGLAASGAITGGVGTYLIGTKTDLFTGDVDVSGLSNYTGKEALLDESYTRAIQLESANNRAVNLINNRVDDSKNACWIDVKKAVVESMNNGNTKSQTESAAENAVDNYYLTPQKNWWGHFNDTVSITKDIISLLGDHNDIQPKDNIRHHQDSSGDREPVRFVSNHALSDKTLVDGSKASVATLDLSIEFKSETGTLTAGIDTLEVNVPGYSTWDVLEDGVYIKRTDADGNVKRASLIPSNFDEINSKIVQAHSDMVVNATTFANNAYDSYAAGDIDPTSIIDAQTFASEFAPDENSSSSYAAAELAALGVDVDLSGEMTIRLEDTGVTVKGVIASDSSPSNGFEVGTTYNPSNYSDQIYLSYDPTEGKMPLPTGHYETLIDGGVLTFLKSPYKKTTHTVNTAADESVDLVAGDFSRDHTNDIWTIDLSADLENPVTDVADVQLTYNGSERSTLIKLSEPFTIQEFVSHDGKELSAATMKDYNQQSSDVQKLEEELAQLREARKGFDEYEVQSGGGGLNLSGLSMFGIPGKAVAVGLGGLGAYLIGN